MYNVSCIYNTHHLNQGCPTFLEQRPLKGNIPVARVTLSTLGCAGGGGTASVFFKLLHSKFL